MHKKNANTKKQIKWVYKSKNKQTDKKNIKLQLPKKTEYKNKQTLLKCLFFYITIKEKAKSYIHIFIYS